MGSDRATKHCEIDLEIRVPRRSRGNADEGMAQAGWDSLTADLQHGLIDYQTPVSLFQAIATTSTIPLARVPWNEPGMIMKLLDAGALGICPMVNSCAECEAFVGACRYAPTGYRSVGPTRAAWLHGPDYVKGANDTVLTFAMIETKRAMENGRHPLDPMSGRPSWPVAGRRAQGRPNRSQVRRRHPDHREGLQEARGLTGIHCGSAEYAKKAIGRGFQFTTILSDNACLQTQPRRR
jgi:4-hydroxy-2-oxoheptanedioate aldolase